MNVLAGIKKFFWGSGQEQDTPRNPGDGSNRSNRLGSGSGSASSRLGGFRATVAVPQEPVLQPAGYEATGGVQGLCWYAESLRQDSDGDYAHQFINADEEAARKSKKVRKQLQVTTVTGGTVVLGRQ